MMLKLNEFPAIRISGGTALLWSALVALVIWGTSLQVRLGQCLVRSVAHRVHGFLLRQLQDLHGQGVHDNHRERETETAAVDAVNQHPLADGKPIGFELQSQVRIGHLPGFAQFLDEVFSPSFVKRAGFHCLQLCIIFNAQILKPFRRHLCIEFDAHT